MHIEPEMHMKINSKYYVDDEANLQLPKLPPSNDTSVLNNDKPDGVLDFLYRLKEHRKAHRIYLRGP